MSPLGRRFVTGAMVTKHCGCAVTASQQMAASKYIRSNLGPREKPRGSVRAAMDSDLIVVGGGPVGAALGLLLSRHGLRAIVLETTEFPRDKPCGEGLLPSGARILQDLGVDLKAAGFPSLAGVRYRLGEAGRSGSALGRFGSGCGFGVRRLRLDAILAEKAGVRTGVRVTGVRTTSGGVTVETSQGRLRARAVIGADGLRSNVRDWLGLTRPPSGAGRYGLVGHFHVPDLDWGEIRVTLLDEIEVYAAPAGPSELLVAVLGARGSLRRAGATVLESYREFAARAHPDLAGADLTSRVWGAGPFNVRPSTVARGRVFLAGDAAGFLDPLTGDAISAGLNQALALAGFLARDFDAAPARYRRWWAAQWRRRRAVTHLARTLTGSSHLADRALRGANLRPQALTSMLEVNDGSRPLWRLGLRDWAALGGFAANRS